MKLKSISIMNTLKAHGKIVLKMDRDSGFYQLTITRVKSGYAVGEHPGGRIRCFTEADVYVLVDDMSMFIERWN